MASQQLVISSIKFNTTFVHTIQNVAFGNLSIDKCIEILQILRDKYSIFHNDTHSENVRQTRDDKLVIFDWGKANIEKISPSSSGLYDRMSLLAFNKWLCASYLLKKGIYEIDETIPLYGGKSLKNIYN